MILSAEIIYLNSINRLVLEMLKLCVYFGVRTKFRNII